MYIKARGLCHICGHRPLSICWKHYHMLPARRKLLRNGTPRVVMIQTRNIGIAIRILKGVLKLRYLIIGSGVAGGVHYSKVCFSK